MDERIALLSVKKYGVTYNFNVGDKTVNDMLAVVENDNATLSDFSALGKDISEEEYAEIQQSDKFTQSVEVDLDGYEKKAEIYTVKNGKGGIAEGDRNDINSNITTYTYDAEIKGLIWKDYYDGSMSAEYYGQHVCSVDYGSNEYNIGGKGWEVIDTHAPEDDPANYMNITREYVKTLPLYKEINPEMDENKDIQMSSYDINNDIQDKAERQAAVMAEAMNSFDESEPVMQDEEMQSIIADREAEKAIDIYEALLDPIGSPEEKAELEQELSKMKENSKEDMKMDEQNVSMEILNELKALREQVSRLEQRANDSEQKLDAISAYIAAGNEAQSFEKTMHVTEIVTQQITNCDKAQFYALDADNRFFTTDGEKREYQNVDSKTNSLIRSMEEKNVSINDVETAFIPVVTKDNRAIGVIVAEKSGGFEGVDFSQFGKDKAIMSQLDLAVKKELTHQEAITDPLTGLKNEQALAEYVISNIEKTVTVMEVTVPSNLPKENAEDIIKAVAKTVESKGRSNINDNVYAVGGGKFVAVMNCPEKKAQSIAEMLTMSVRATNITTSVKQVKLGEMQFTQQKVQASIKKVQARNVDPKTALRNDFSKAAKLEDFAKCANKYFNSIGNKVTNPKGEVKNNCYAIYAQDQIGERVKIRNHDNMIEVQLGINKSGQYAGKPFALVVDHTTIDDTKRFYVNSPADLKNIIAEKIPAEAIEVVTAFKEFDKPKKEQPKIDDITSGVLAEDIERYCDAGKEIEQKMVEEVKDEVKIEQDKNEVGGDVGGDR